MIPIVEKFYSLQGEGSETGKPSIFIRLGGCNLTCSGFGCKFKSPLTGEELVGCDSHFAVNSKHFRQEWDYIETFQEMVNVIDVEMPKDSPYMKPLIVFTGGEPLLYATSQIMLDTLDYYVSRGYEVWFETNGTIDIDFKEYPIYNEVNFAISPKLSNSGEDKSKTFKPNICNNLLKNTKKSFFKFVITPESINEVVEFLNATPYYGQVYVMPQGSTIQELNENSKFVFEYAMKMGFFYSDRIHIRVFDDLQGV